jgi:hypothetical protein
MLPIGEPPTHADRPGKAHPRLLLAFTSAHALTSFSTIA